MSPLTATLPAAATLPAGGTTMMALQVVIGLCVVAGAFMILTHSVDELTPAPRRALFAVMLAAGTWYALEPIILGVPTSTKPGLFFAGFTSWITMRWQRTQAQLAVLRSK